MDQDTLTRRLPEIFSFLEVEGYPSNPSAENLEIFKSTVNEFYAEAQASHSKTIKRWSQASLELSVKVLSRVSRGFKPLIHKNQVNELFETESRLHQEFYASGARLLNLRRAEELTRVLPEAVSGDADLRAWFLVLLSRVEKYTPNLPA